MPPFNLETAPEMEPAPTVFTKEEVNFLLHKLDFCRPLLQPLVDAVDPFTLTVGIAFLQAALEAQAQESRAAFDEIRDLFLGVYPGLMEADRISNPETPSEEFIILWPKPAEGVASISPGYTDPVIIQPGSSLLQ